MPRNGDDGAEARRIGANLRRRRKTLKMSQSEVGYAIGVTQAQIVKYEQGQAEIPCSKVGALVDFLQMDANTFFGVAPRSVLDGMIDGAPDWAMSIVSKLVQMNREDVRALEHILAAMADRTTAAA